MRPQLIPEPIQEGRLYPQLPKGETISVAWYRTEPGQGCGGPTQTHAVLLVTDSIPLWVYVFITVIAILLVGSVILLAICMTWRLSGKECAGASSLLFSHVSSLLAPASCHALFKGYPSLCPSMPN